MPVLLHEARRDTLVVFPRPVGRVTSYWLATAVVAAVLAIPPLVTGFATFWMLQIATGCVAVFAIAGTIQWFAISRTRIDRARGCISFADGSTLDLSRVLALELHAGTHVAISAENSDVANPARINVTRLSLHAARATDDDASTRFELTYDSDRARITDAARELARRLGVSLVDPVGAAEPPSALPAARVVSGP